MAKRSFLQPPTQISGLIPARSTMRPYTHIGIKRNPVRSLPPAPPLPPAARLRPRFAAAPVVRTHVGVGRFSRAARGHVRRAAERALSRVAAAERVDLGLAREGVVADGQFDGLQAL